MYVFETTVFTVIHLYIIILYIIKGNTFATNENKYFQTIWLLGMNFFSMFETSKTKKCVNKTYAKD